jgi:tetratricopeptide (TPR) repeat protein
MNTKFRFIPITDRNTINRWRYLSISILFFVVLFFCFCTHPKKKSVEYLNKKHQLSFLIDSLDNEDIYRIPKEVLSRLPKAISLANELQDSVSLCQIMIIKAGCFCQLEQLDSTFIIAQQALQIAKSIANDTLLAKANNLIGHFFVNANDYVNATKFYTEAFLLMEKSGNNIGKAVILNGLGNIYGCIGDLKKSIECYTKALSVFDSVHDEVKTAIICLNLVEAYSAVNDNLNARKCYKKSFSILEKYGDTLQMTKLLSNQSLFYINIGRIDSAILTLHTVMDYSTTINNKQIYCITLYNLGLLYYAHKNDIKQAMYFIEKCLRINQGILDLEIEMNAYHALSEIESSIGNYKKTNDFFKKYIALRDSIKGGDVKKEIIAIELQNNFQKQEYKTALLQKKLELKGKQNTILFISLFAFLFFVGMIILVISTAYNSLKKSNTIKELENQRLEKQMEIDRKINEIEKLKVDAELDAKNKELVSYSLKLITKNDLLNDISKLADKYYNDNDLNRPFYNDLTKIIEDNLNMDKEWNQFKVLFEKVHHGFFNRLKQGYPELTEHELRFCAYIKINLGTKEIARMLNISPDTVRKSKYRLKKKLTLDEDTYIEDFLRYI